jgi:MFS family permease
VSETQDNRAPTGAAAAFRVPYFGAVWSSNFLQFFASQIHLFTLQWLITDLSESRTLLGLAIAINGATVALASTAAGVAADRFAKRDLLIATRVGMTVLVLAMAAGVYAGVIELWHILAASAVGGLFSAISQPAAQTYVFDVVGRERAQAAVALNSAGIGLGQMGGPALAGALIAFGGMAGSWLGAAAALLIAVLLLARVPIKGLSPGERRAPLREFREGFSFVLSQPPVLLSLVACSMAFFNGAIFTMRPVFARHVLEVGSQGMGGMAAAAGLGTLLGALVATRLGSLRRPGIAITLSMFAFSSCLLLYSFAFSYPYILAVEFASGLAAQVWQISTFFGLQMAVPEAMRGRVMGMVFTVVQLAQVGGLFVGRLADRVGDQLAMGIFGATPMVILALLLLFGFRPLLELGRTSAET